MRAKPSSTAIGIFSRSGTFSAPLTIPSNLISRAAPCVTMRNVAKLRGSEPIRDARAVPGVAEGEGLLHDAHNLMNALGLYVDLLALPGVLKPEHSHYAEELRVLATRSGTLMERLVLSLPTMYQTANPAENSGRAGKAIREGKAKRMREEAAESSTPARGVNLREIVERGSGLLSQVAGGRLIELTYGPAASEPAPVAEEDVERILVNLVRNAAAALDRRGVPAEAKARRETIANGALGARRPPVYDRTADPDPDAVRIGIGVVQNRVDDPTSWSFRRVRLTVEDSGCGMSAEQLERLLRGSRAPSRGSHGIGFCVVRELVAAGGGDLRVMSQAGLGTRVQIEWPVLNSIAASAMSHENQSDRIDQSEQSAPHTRSVACKEEWPLC